MRWVTIHLAPGETDRSLERALLALDPGAETILVTGRNGRTGVRVDSRLALRYLAAADASGQPAPAAELPPPVAETPKTTPARPKKAATTKKTEEV